MYSPRDDERSEQPSGRHRTAGPQAGSLGNLLAQKADPNDPKTKDDPYTFETDPDGKEFAGGTSQIGGGDKPGAPGAVASGAPGGTGTGEAKKGPLSAPPPPPPE